jgi:hypothetical protein
VSGKVKNEEWEKEGKERGKRERDRIGVIVKSAKE